MDRPEMERTLLAQFVSTRRSQIMPFEAECGCWLRILPDRSVDQMWCAEHSALTPEQLQTLRDRKNTPPYP